MAFGSLPSVLGSGGGTAYSLIGGTGLFADGTAAAPSISLASAPTTGFYKYNDSTFGYSSGGTQSLLFGGDGVIYGANLGSTLYMPAVGGVILTAGGSSKNITLTPSGTGVTVFSAGNVQIAGSGNALLTDKILSYTGNPIQISTASVNVLIGTSTDSGARLQVNGTATFAGTIQPQLATTAGAPSYVKGAIYFDTTLNKLRVGGASAWETITSV